MTRILVVGSSHTGAVYLGWKTVKDEFPDIEADFLAVPAYVLERLSLRDGTIYGLHETTGLSEKILSMIRQTSGTLTRDLSLYSHVVFVGRAVLVWRLLRVLVKIGVLGMRQMSPAQQTLVSLATFRAICHDTASQSISRQAPVTMANLRVAVTSIPMRSEITAERPEEENYPDAKAARDFPDGLRDGFAMFQDIVEQVYAAEGATFIRQPDETIGDFGYTKAEFSRGSIKLDASLGAEDDLTHMNERFGQLISRAIGNWVTGA